MNDRGWILASAAICIGAVILHWWWSLVIGAYCLGYFIGGTVRPAAKRYEAERAERER